MPSPPSLAPGKLTKRRVDAAAPRERPYYVTDAGGGGVPGFALRVWPSGRKVYVLRYRPGGRATPETVVTIGEHGPFTVEQARTIALQLRADVTAARRDPARDPRARRRAARAAHRAAAEAPTVADVADRFLADCVRRGIKPATLEVYTRLLGAPERRLGPKKGQAIPGPLRVALGGKKASEVTRKDVQALYDARRERAPGAARRLVKTLGTLYAFARSDDLVPPDTNPTRDVRVLKGAPPRRAALTREAYAALGDALDAAARTGLPAAPERKARARGMSAKRKAAQTGRVRGPYAPREGPAPPRKQNPVHVACVRFLAITGWRSAEAKALRWDVLDTERRVARLVDTKTGASERPLGKAAWAILDARRASLEAAGVESAFVFARLDEPRRPIAELDHVWAHVRHAAGLSITLHGLRHAFVTVAREQGYGDHVVAAVIGHALGSTQTSRYGMAPGDVVAEAAERTSAAIATRLTGQPSGARVLRFRARKFGSGRA
jgi:integrase